MLIFNFQGCERTALGKAVEADVGILEPRRWTDAQIAFFPIVAAVDKNVEVATVGAPAGRTEKRSTMCVVSTYSSGHRGIQGKSAAERGRIETEFSAINIEGAAVGEGGIGVSVAAH